MNNQRLKWLYLLCGVIVIVAVVVSVTGIFNEIRGYANAEKYSVGETEIGEPVKNLSINWTSGKVSIAYHGENTVEVREFSKKDLSEDQELRWWLDGETLRIQFAKSGLRLNWDLEKELAVTLPEGMTLEDAEINVTSADVTAKELKAENLSLNTTSGDATIQAEAKKLAANATSGALALTLTGEPHEIRINSTSGNVLLEAEKAKKMKIGSTSGNLEIHCAESEETELSSTSGTIRTNLKKIRQVKIGSTSGSVTAALPQTPGLTAEISTTSGDVNMEMPMEKDGKTWRCGDGSGKVSISTTSGNVRIMEAE